MVALKKQCADGHGRPQVNRRISAALTMGVALAALVACSDSGGDSTAEPSASVAPSTAEPSPTVDPEVQKAVDAYLAYSAASNKAQENPVGKGEKLPKEADFERWSFDPARAQTLVDIHVLDTYNAEYRGNAPESHVDVESSDLAASPYPLVKLTDCLVPRGEYVPFNRKTGKPLRLTGGANLEEPYLSMIEVVKVDDRWGVRSLEVQQEGTCEP
ncbi:hypothetical protein LWF15_24315 [Kineosporia rhizophila]|uniref:hypothetical protein n=1 Tax=Kineosporia rhizophila TaxID=84633 RepID=UPI001E449528|nr:hypothetical protein [Kineosporia rhizophila]MCE0538628.1 hypothetical protein [Kineosporia rhizophila]